MNPEPLPNLPARRSLGELAFHRPVVIVHIYQPGVKGGEPVTEQNEAYAYEPFLRLVASQTHLN